MVTAAVEPEPGHATVELVVVPVVVDVGAELLVEGAEVDEVVVEEDACFLALELEHPARINDKPAMHTPKRRMPLRLRTGLMRCIMAPRSRPA